MKSIYIKAYVLAEMSEMLPVCLHFKCATVFLQNVIESDFVYIYEYNSDSRTRAHLSF